MRCQSHPDVETARQCTSCAIPWCDSCVKTIGGRRVCPSCGHQVITVDADTLSLGGTFKDIGARLLTIGGLFVCVGIGALSLLATFSRLFALLHIAAVAGYYFVLIRHVGEGNPKLPGSTEGTLDWNDIIGYAVRGIMVGVSAFLPLIFYLILVDVWDFYEIIAMLVIGQLYTPAVVLAVLLSGSWLGALWPVAWIKIIAAAPLRYLRFSGIWFATAIAGGLLSSAIDGSLPDGILGAWITAALSAWLTFAQAIVVGHYVRENRTAFGWTEAVSVSHTSVAPDPLPVATARSLPSAPRTHSPTAQPMQPSADPRYGAPASQRARRQSRMPSSIPLDDGPVEAEQMAPGERPVEQPPRPQRGSVVEVDRRPRDPSGMVIGSSIPVDAAALKATIQAGNPVRGLIRYSTQTMALSTAGIEAVREDGSHCTIEWSAVVGIVARRMPAVDVENAITFVDIVSTPGSTIRLVPWTTIKGVELPGTPAERARVFIRLVRRYSENVRMDSGTQSFVDGSGMPVQLPDAATLAEHDRRLA